VCSSALADRRTAAGSPASRRDGVSALSRRDAGLPACVRGSSARWVRRRRSFHGPGKRAVGPRVRSGAWTDIPDCDGADTGRARIRRGSRTADLVPDRSERSHPSAGDRVLRRARVATRRQPPAGRAVRPGRHCGSAMSDTTTVSLGLAFLAGLVSFLSPCVFPIVPSYVGFVTGMPLDELGDGTRSDARRHAAIHAALFVLGFSLVFVALGASATALGAMLRRSLPLLQQAGGVLIAVFGLYLLGVIRIPALMRERRLSLASRPAGKLGSVLVGVVFGAGWTPCVGPILATLLLYASLEQTLG